MDKLTLKCLISVHRHRLDVNMKMVLKKKGNFLQETKYFEIFRDFMIFWDFSKQFKEVFKRLTDQKWGFTVINK